MTLFLGLREYIDISIYNPLSSLPFSGNKILIWPPRHGPPLYSLMMFFLLQALVVIKCKSAGFPRSTAVQVGKN